ALLIVSLFAGCGGGGGGGGGGFVGGGSSFNPVPLDQFNPVLTSANPIDQGAAQTMTIQSISTAQLSDDGEFLRRATADLLGRIPTRTETDTFIAATNKDKRIQKIDELLGSPEFAHHWAYDIIGPWCCVGNNADAFNSAIEFDLAVN